ncbi:hypothetical protein VNI00_018429, partial [Paramarasmius palmivorus]
MSYVKTISIPSLEEAKLASKLDKGHQLFFTHPIISDTNKDQIGTSWSYTLLPTLKALVARCEDLFHWKRLNVMEKNFSRLFFSDFCVKYLTTIAFPAFSSRHTEWNWLPVVKIADLQVTAHDTLYR